MSNKFLELSKFRKVKTDGSTTTLRHYQGHELTIAHSKLSQKMREQLDAIPLDKQKEPKEQHFDTGGTANPDVIPDFPTETDEAEGRNGMIGTDPQPAPESTPALSPLPTPANVPDVNPNDPSGALDTVARQQITGVQEQGQGAQQEAIAKGQEAQAVGNLQPDLQRNLETTQNNYQNHLSAINQNVQATEKWLNEHPVDNNHYIENMSTGSKIMTGIGLLLGGFVGPSGTQFLQKQIDDDIATQKANIGTKEGLLNEFHKQLGDLDTATSATKLFYNQVVSSKIQEKMGQAATPLAQAALLKAKGDTDAKIAELQQRIVMNKMLMGGNQGQDAEAQYQKRRQALMVMGENDFVKDMDAHHLPGVPGQTSVPVTTDDQKSIKQLTDLSANYKDAQDYINNVGKFGTMPFTEKQAYGKSLSNNIELQLGQLESLQRFTPEEHKIYSQLVPDLAGTKFTGQDQAKINQLVRQVEIKKASILHGLGAQGGNIPTAQNQPQGSPQSQNNNQTKAPPTRKMYQGKWYVRGPNGEAIPE